MTAQVDVFHAAAKVLDRSGVTWWLSDGSVLGAVREGAFLAGDPDVDLGVWAAHMPTVRAAFAGDGWLLKRDRAGQLWPTRDGVKVDIHGHHHGGQRAWYRLGKREELAYEFDARLFGDLDLIEFCGLTCRVPSPVEDYLTAHYGQGWRMPVKSWRWNVDPPCLIRGVR